LSTYCAEETFPGDIHGNPAFHGCCTAPYEFLARVENPIPRLQATVFLSAKVFSISPQCSHLVQDIPSKFRSVENHWMLLKYELLPNLRQGVQVSFVGSACSRYCRWHRTVRRIPGFIASRSYVHSASCTPSCACRSVSPASPLPVSVCTRAGVAFMSC